MARISRRPLRDINEWGTIDIEALTMSIRSRLSTELSYALTTFTILSILRGQTPGSGFLISQCPDLLEEALDLLEDEAFGEEDVPETDADHIRITTHREMANLVYDKGSQPFAALERHQGSKDPDLGPRQRPANFVLAVVNIIRNLAVISDNVGYLAKHERVLDLLLRLCAVTRGDDGTPQARSAVFSLTDLIIVRKEVLYILTALAPSIHLHCPPSPHTTKVARRVFELIASYLIDPADAISPFGCAQLAGIPLNGQLKPPMFSDAALELFTRLSHPDTNRQAFAKVLPQEWIWRLFESLIHRLPLVDADFQLVARDAWLCYLEKLVMSLYSLAFLAPPELKERFKADRRLGFTKVMFRLIQRLLAGPNPDSRQWSVVCVRRAIETMKVVDDGEDSFDTSQAATPTLSFGMGYGEIGENGTEKGTGLLGGYRQHAWDLLMMRDMDKVMFSELESLTRVE
jgi:SWI/SNF chromatin-remodeling complex subunit SWI1